MAASVFARRRWKLLGDAITGSNSVSDVQDDCSRKPKGRFGLIPCHRSSSAAHSLLTDPDKVDSSEAIEDVVYILPPLCADRHLGHPQGDPPRLLLRQRRADAPFTLSDHVVSQDSGVDNTGNVCLWPSEEVLAHICCSNPQLFRGKRVIELGAGYGLAGMAVAACTGAARVLLTDGNPLVVERLAGNIQRNAHLFGPCHVSAEHLRWSLRDDAGLPCGEFDVVIASDCTFFKGYHRELASTLQWVLRKGDGSGKSCDTAMRGGAPSSLSPEPAAGSEAPGHAAASQLPNSTGVGLTVQANGEGAAYLASMGSTQVDDGSGNVLPGLSPSLCTDVGNSPKSVWDGAPPACECSNGMASLDVKSTTSKDVWQPSKMGAAPMALLLNPPRGGTLDAFITTMREDFGSLEARLWTRYDDDVWRLHQSFLDGSNAAWPGYTAEFCYPLLLVISRDAMGTKV